MVRKGVKLIGGNDLPARTQPCQCALRQKPRGPPGTHAKDGVLTLDTDDELIAGCLIAQDGTVAAATFIPGAN